MISSINAVTHNYTNKNHLSINHFFQKLDDLSELIKELDSEKNPASTFPALYASMMLTGDFNDLTYQWITKQLTIVDHWSDQWKHVNHSKFEEAFQLLNFDHKFALLIGAYRLAKLGENNSDHKGTKQNHRAAAGVFKDYLIKLIQDNSLAFQVMDLNTLSIKNTKALKFNQTTLSPDFLNVISKQNQFKEVDRQSIPFKMTVSAIFTAIGLAAGTYLYRSLSAQPIPPPPKSSLEVSYDMAKNNLSLFLGTTALISSVFTHLLYSIKKAELENEKIKLKDEKAELENEKIKLKDEKAELQNEKIKLKNEEAKLVKRKLALPQSVEGQSRKPKNTRTIRRYNRDRELKLLKQKFEVTYSMRLKAAIENLIQVDVNTIPEQHIVNLSQYIDEIISLNYELKFNEFASTDLYNKKLSLQETDCYKKFKKEQKNSKKNTCISTEKTNLEASLKRIKALENLLPQNYRFFTD